MRVAKLLQLGLTVALGGAACNWNDFSSALDKAPVVSFDNGSSTGSLSVLPLAPPAPGGKVSARMLVSRTNSTYLALAEFDKDGKVTLQPASDTAQAGWGNTPITSMAPLDPANPASPIILGTAGLGATSTQPGGGVSLLSLTAAADGTASFAVQPGVQGLDHFGIAVAAGRVTDLAGPAQFVVASDDKVQVLGADALTPGVSTACQSVNFAASTTGIRPLLVADLLPGGGQEIVLSGLGRVNFLQYNPTTATLDCSPLVLTQGTSVNFGTSLAAADFDGDGNVDLAVGSPPDRVYVYFGPLALPPAQLQTVTIVSSNGASFGRQLAAYTVPGQPASQLLVADPSAMVGARSGAGQVVLIAVPRSAPQVDAMLVTMTRVFDSSGDSPTGVFGNSVGGLLFDTRTCNPAGSIVVLPWASSGTSVLTYFNYPTTPAVPPPVSVADPRCFIK